LDEIVLKLVKKYKTSDPFQLAQALNIMVRYADLGEETKGLYYKKIRRRFIVIHERLDQQWARMVCAHELGHDRLHPGISRFWIDEHSFFNAGKYERQANLFAIKLLTYPNVQMEDEPLNWYLARNNIPQEMHTFFN